MRQGGGKGAIMPISVSMTRRWVGPKSRQITQVEVLKYYFMIQEDCADVINGVGVHDSM